MRLGYYHWIDGFTPSVSPLAAGWLLLAAVCRRRVAVRFPETMGAVYGRCSIDGEVPSMRVVTRSLTLVIAVWLPVAAALAIILASMCEVQS